MQDRLDFLRQGFAKSQKLIEIGPCHNPVFPKRDGWSVHSIDHMDQAGLREKYRGDPAVDPNLIEWVDFIWTGGSLSDAVPPEHRGSFDALVASHVVEHFPDLVAFLQAAETLTRPDGRMVLAIPDKRVCFDYYRPISTIGDVLEAREQKRTRHSTASIWDYFFHQAVKHQQPGWGRTDRAPLRFIYSFNDPIGYLERSRSGEYLDVHAWVFVPASFKLILLLLAKLELTDWWVDRSAAADLTEFYVWLRRGGRAAASSMSEAQLSDQRAGLLEEMLIELGEQSLQLADGFPSRHEPESGAVALSLPQPAAATAKTSRNRMRRLRGLLCLR